MKTRRIHCKICGKLFTRRGMVKHVNARHKEQSTMESEFSRLYNEISAKLDASIERSTRLKRLLEELEHLSQEK